MRVQLMLTCLCDAVYGDVGAATVKVLEHAGCEVVFPEDQTCCGQPPFNAGDWDSARPIAERTIEVFGIGKPDQIPVVTPSASCAAMLRHGYKELIPGFEATKTYELCEFIVNVLRREDWGGEVSARKVALHSSCHGRMLGLQDEQERLLHSIRGVQAVSFGSPEQCCGFGGSFTITHGKVSEGIGLEKLSQIEKAGVDQIVSGDMGCLAHLNGLISRHGMAIQTTHVAQLLAEAVAT